MRSILHSSFARPRARIALLRKPTADTDKAAHVQFRAPLPSSGARLLQPLSER